MVADAPPDNDRLRAATTTATPHTIISQQFQKLLHVLMGLRLRAGGVGGNVGYKSQWRG